MRAKLIIKGGVQGNFQIFNKLSMYESFTYHFTDIVVQYDRIGAAKQDIAKAYIRLKEEGEKPTIRRKNGMAYEMSYDASKVYIVNT